MVKTENFDKVFVASPDELRDWLLEHHTQEESVWLVTYKKRSNFYLPYDDIVEEALCFGWIDSVPKKVDDQRSCVLLSPRRPNSVWSAVNKRRVEKLQKENRLTKADWTRSNEPNGMDRGPFWTMSKP